MTRVCRPSADETRKKILRVAQKLFAKKGFAGTSIGDIAKGAAINPSLIYHHFQDKKNLWNLVKVNLLENYGKCHEVKALDALAHGDLRSFLKETVDLRFGFLDKNPDVVRMLSWQRLEPNEKELHHTSYATPEQWCAIIKDLQARGEIRPELNPAIIVILIWNSVLGVLMDAQRLFPNACMKSASKKEMLEMITDCLYHAFSPKLSI